MKYRKWILASLKAAWHRTATVNLIVTRRCDLKCSYCHAAKKSKELDANSWIQIAKRLSSRFAVFTISGGEPLLYRPLPELIQGLSRIGITGLCTNLRQLDTVSSEVFKGLDYLNFSIDHLEENSDDLPSLKNAFGKLDGVAEMARSNNFVLRGNAVITWRNMGAIPDVVQEMTRRGIPLNLQLVQSPNDADGFQSADRQVKLKQLSQTLLVMRRQGYLIDQSEAYLKGFHGFSAGISSLSCLAGKTYLAVDSDGRLMPCQATSPVGKPIHEIGTVELEGALKLLPASVPCNCRCWWNCYHEYQAWASDPWLYMFKNGAGMIRRPHPAQRVHDNPGK